MKTYDMKAKDVAELFGVTGMTLGHWRKKRKNLSCQKTLHGFLYNKEEVMALYEKRQAVEIYEIE